MLISDNNRMRIEQCVSAYNEKSLFTDERDFYRLHLRYRRPTRVVVNVLGKFIENDTRTLGLDQDTAIRLVSNEPGQTEALCLAAHRRTEVHSLHHTVYPEADTDDSDVIHTDNVTPTGQWSEPCISVNTNASCTMPVRSPLTKT